MPDKKQVLAASAVILFIWSGLANCETWRLKKDGQLQAVTADGQDRYLLAAAKIKQMAGRGQAQQVIESLDRLKKDFPEIAGPDLDAFMQAEILAAQGKYAKAVRSYDKFLNTFSESPLYDAALERQFSIAKSFLAGQKRPVLKFFKIKGYAEGARIMEQIAVRTGDNPMAIRAQLGIADSLEKTGKFKEAFEKWSEISQNWPAGQIGKEALLAMGRCKHAAYKGVDYNGSNLISAKGYYQQFKAKYPEDARKFEIEKKLAQIEEQLAYKQFYIGRYYQETDDMQSANLYYRMVLNNWPESVAAKMSRAAAGSKKMDTNEKSKWQKTIIDKIEKLFL